MTRSVGLALVALLIILGAAFFLYGWLFPTNDGGDVVVVSVVDAGPAARGTPPPTAADAGRGATTGDAGTAASAGPRQAEVVAVRGFVESKSPKAESWSPLTLGQKLDEDESVRTGRNGEARLRLSDGVEVRLSPRSEFSIRELSAGVSQVRLEVGHVAATVDESGKEVLRVEARGTDAVAETRGGEFGMVSDGEGSVAVATTTGSVKLTAKGKSVDVAAGTTSTVQKGAAPTAPTAMPTSLLLKVADPVKRRTNSTATFVEGTTTPGALVHAQDKVALADRAGRFKVPVTLQDGSNRIGVTVIDATGRSKDVEVPEIVVDRKKPQIETQMNWGGQ